MEISAVWERGREGTGKKKKKVVWIRWSGEMIHEYLWVNAYLGGYNLQKQYFAWKIQPNFHPQDNAPLLRIKVTLGWMKVGREMQFYMLY